MSWWEKYFAPGDLRTQVNNQLAENAKLKDELDSVPAQPALPKRIDAAHRARRQNAMFFGGLAFTCLTALVTRRALTKKKLAMYPHLQPTVGKDAKLELPKFTPSNTPPKAEGGLDAAEALFLATLNVGAVFMASVGAFMKFADVADTEDLRDYVRSGIGYDVYAGDTEADREIEQWFAEVLSRKDGTGDLKTTIVEKMAELADIEKKRKAEVGDTELADIQRKRKALEKISAEKAA
ncbi:uncharacterized protein MYCGRDRAFT_77999 [Zymoseptoria tritici IPO323]|uniref:Altered inheritance of mitochondria protein 11 n=2 Tax=Zymoseptoria tritici TaxID=1047171 RepID=F9XQF2_ZYMTI|nr:uncharacterized protein MYCGRDRAFT_77999 [Zymoseptoria tritici IPO323]EGP82631.1 hypothetical protein MYCGRDRAFT_77999 [Zymoseptoria tritici IPO323]